MREIKFRLWDTMNKEWFCKQEPVYWNILRNLNENRDNGDVEIQQFTGLLDKNKKEIYEGDIVSVYEDERNAHVRFDEESAIFKLSFSKVGEKDADNSLHFSFGGDANPRAKDCEVIGNIFENPGLIKQSGEKIKVK